MTLPVDCNCWSNEANSVLDTPLGKSEAIVLVSVLKLRGLELPRCFRLATTKAILSSLILTTAGALGGALGLA